MCSCNSSQMHEDLVGNSESDRTSLPSSSRRCTFIECRFVSFICKIDFHFDVQFYRMNLFSGTCWCYWGPQHMQQFWNSNRIHDYVLYLSEADTVFWCEQILHCCSTWTIHLIAFYYRFRQPNEAVCAEVYVRTYEYSWFAVFNWGQKPYPVNRRGWQ